MSSDKRSLRSPLGRERAEFRRFLWLVAALSLLVLTVGVVLRQLYADSGKALMTEDADAIVFELAILIAGTLLGTVIVGILIDEYQTKFGEASTNLSQLLASEGITDVYKSANDVRLLQDLETAISSARERVVGLGLGLGILHNNRALLVALAERVNASDHLLVDIYLGDEQNQGVQNRIAEEQTWHDSNGMNYDPAWVQRFPSEIKSVLTALVTKDKQPNIHVRTVDSCPSIGLIKVDDRLFYFPYGPPSVRGSESPWIQLVDGDTGNLVRFLHRCIEYYQTQFGTAHD